MESPGQQLTSGGHGFSPSLSLIFGYIKFTLFMVGTWPSPNNPGEWSVLIGWARVTCFTTVAEEGAP